MNAAMAAPSTSDLLKVLSDQQKTLRDEISSRIGYQNSLVQYIATLIAAATAGAISLRTAAALQTGWKSQQIAAAVFLILPMATTPLGLLVLHHQRVIGRIRRYLANPWQRAMCTSLGTDQIPLEMNFDETPQASLNERVRRNGFTVLVLAPAAGAIAAIGAVASIGSYFDSTNPVPALGFWTASAIDILTLILLLRVVFSE